MISMQIVLKLQYEPSVSSRLTYRQYDVRITGVKGAILIFGHSDHLEFLQTDTAIRSTTVELM